MSRADLGHDARAAGTCHTPSGRCFLRAGARGRAAVPRATATPVSAPHCRPAPGWPASGAGRRSAGRLASIGGGHYRRERARLPYQWQQSWLEANWATPRVEEEWRRCRAGPGHLAFQLRRVARRRGTLQQYDTNVNTLTCSPFSGGAGIASRTCPSTVGPAGRWLVMTGVRQSRTLTSWGLG